MALKISLVGVGLLVIFLAQFASSSPVGSKSSDDNNSLVREKRQLNAIQSKLVELLNVSKILFKLNCFYIDEIVKYTSIPQNYFY